MALTPAQATEMIYRSMLTGVPTAEFDAAGGYAAVRSLAAQSGADMGRPSNEAILKYGPQIAAQGYGDASYSPGFDLGDRDPDLAANGYSNYYDQAKAGGGPSPTVLLQRQLAEQQLKYEQLVAQYSNTGGSSTGGSSTGGSSTVANGGGGTVGGGGVVGGGVTGGGLINEGNNTAGFTTGSAQPAPGLINGALYPSLTPTAPTSFVPGVQNGLADNPFAPGPVRVNLPPGVINQNPFITNRS